MQEFSKQDALEFECPNCGPKEPKVKVQDRPVIGTVSSGGHKTNSADDFAKCACCGREFGREEIDELTVRAGMHKLGLTR